MKGLRLARSRRGGGPETTACFTCHKSTTGIWLHERANTAFRLLRSDAASACDGGAITAASECSSSLLHLISMFGAWFGFYTVVTAASINLPQVCNPSAPAHCMADRKLLLLCSRCGSGTASREHGRPAVIAHRTMSK